MKFSLDLQSTFQLDNRGGANSANFDEKVHKPQSWYTYWSLADAQVKKEDQEENKNKYLGYD